MRIEMPSTYKGLAAFVGAMNFVGNKWVPNFAAEMKPIIDLQKTEQKSQKAKHSMRRPPWESHPEALLAFNRTKLLVAEAHPLNMPRTDLPYGIAFDASTHGSGTVIFNRRFPGDKPCPENIISYRSHVWNACERKHINSPYRLELMALVQALKDYREYIACAKFYIYTDCKALTWLNTEGKMNKHILTYIEILGEFDYTIEHVAGETNTFPDCLSRIQESKWKWDEDTRGDVGKELIIVDDSYLDKASRIMGMKTSATDESRLEVLRKVHNLGHYGAKNMIEQLKLMRQDLNWKGMYEDVKQYLKSCITCGKWNLGRKIFQGLRAVYAFLPWDHIQYDFITSFPPVEGYTVILLIVDVFTGFVVLKPMKGRSANELADTLFGVFALFGVPKIVQSDCEAAAKSEIINCLYKRLNISGIFTTPYVHRELGKAESQVKVASNTLRKMVSETGTNWLEMLDLCMIAMNASIKELTGLSPHCLMFNRPVGIFEEFKFDYNLDVEDENHVKKWIDHQQKVLDELFPAVNNRIKAQKERMIKSFNEKHIIADDVLKIGTKVLLKDDLKSNKNSPNYDAIMRVEEVLPHLNYMLKDLAGGIFGPVVRDQVKVINISDDDLVNHRYINKIIEHRVINKETEYLINWAGTGPECNTWMKWNDVPENSIAKYQASCKRVIATKEAKTGKLKVATVKKPVQTKSRRLIQRKVKASKKPALPNLTQYKKTYVTTRKR